MANNCHFTYADFVTSKKANELKVKLSTWQGERGDDFSTLYGLRVYISKPLGNMAEIATLMRKYFSFTGENYDIKDYLEEFACEYGVEDEDVENGNWKKSELGDEMVLFVVDGWERNYYPEELWNLGVSPICMWQIEGEKIIHFIPDEYYDDFDLFNTENKKEYFDEAFETYGNKAYFKHFKKVLKQLAPEIPAPYYQILTPDELTDFGQSTHFFADNDESYPVIDTYTMTKIRMIENPTE